MRPRSICEPYAETLDWHLLRNVMRNLMQNLMQDLVWNLLRALGGRRIISCCHSCHAWCRSLCRNPDVEPRAEPCASKVGILNENDMRPRSCIRPASNIIIMKHCLKCRSSNENHKKPYANIVLNFFISIYI